MSITQNSKIRSITHSTLVVGADIAKKAHVARASDVRGVELGKPLTFDNSRRGFEKLLLWIETIMAEHSFNNVVLGVEPTGHYWMNLAQFLRHQGIQVVLVNPMHVKKTKELEDNNPTKSDRKDARVISQLVKDGRYSVPHIPEDIYAELRVGMNERDRLSEDLKRVQARIEKPKPVVFPEEHLQLIPLAITEYEKAAGEGIEFKSGLYQCSQAIDGFSEIRAATCQIHAVDVCQRQHGNSSARTISRKQLGIKAGINFDSGVSNTNQEGGWRGRLDWRVGDGNRKPSSR